MTSSFPAPVQSLLRTLQEAHFEVFVVGGAVRDLLRNAPVRDWDFTTNATPEHIQALFPNHFYDNQFGTVGVAGKYVGDEAHPEDVYEITTYRSESGYADHRRPDAVQWGKTLIEDLTRRDFTINALAMDPNGTVIDPFHGETDLRNGVIKAVGNPEERFHEDALRMLRAIRFGAQLGFFIEPRTLAAIQTHSATIQHISWERVRDEFLKILSSEYPDEGLNLLHTTGLLQHILPELLEGRGVDQAHHHIYDVWTHTLQSVKHCPTKDPIVRFAVLLHDIAKPRTANKTKRPDGTEEPVTFYNHEVVGAHLAKEIAQRFRLSKKDTSRVFTLVRWHMFVYDKEVTDAYIRRFIRRVGVENIEDMISLRIADRLGSGAKRTSWRLEEMQARIREQLIQPFTLRDLKIDGEILMRELNLRPGPMLGTLLKELFEEVLEEPTRNTREYLLDRAKLLLEKNSG